MKEGMSLKGLTISKRIQGSIDNQFSMCRDVDIALQGDAEDYAKHNFHYSLQTCKRSQHLQLSNSNHACVSAILARSKTAAF